MKLSFQQWTFWKPLSAVVVIIVSEVSGRQNCGMTFCRAGIADSNRHTHTNLPLILADGGGGALTPGRLVQHESKPLCNLFLTLADKMGAKGLERRGDSTGRPGHI